MAAAIDHIPPRGQQTIRYYGLYSNKSRGLPRRNTLEGEPIVEKQPAPNPPIVPPPPKVTARVIRPLWRDLILRVWGIDPLLCARCKGTMTAIDTFRRPAEVKFFLRLKEIWEAVIDIPPPPDPPFDIETFEPIEPPWQAIREWIPDDDSEPSADLFNQRRDSRKQVGILREDGSILVLEDN